MSCRKPSIISLCYRPLTRARALKELYKNDPAIADEVRELLEADAASLQLPAMDIEHLLRDALKQDDRSLPAHGQIGPYRIIRLLGEGGMGVVYLAQRTDIAGYVAVKVLRDAWISPIRRQRFAAEQQMLGLLHHPSIARIYDAGTTKRRNSVVRDGILRRRLHYGLFT